MSSFPHNLILRLGLKAFGGAEFGGYAPLPAPAAEVRTDSRRMRVYGRCTSEAVDRSREIVVANGVDWSEYRQNPICTINHGWREPEKLIGHARIDGQFTPKLSADGRGWDFGCQFIQTGPQAGRAAEAFALVDTGVLRGVSLGFRFLGVHSAQITAPDGQPALRIDRCTPFEITFLPVPDNPDAVVHVVEKGVNGRRLSQPWMDILRPMVPPVKYHGFTPHKREKAMAQPTPDPAADQDADPTQQQQPQQPPTPASQLPQVKPSIAFLMATEQYTMGFIRFLKQQAEVQDHPEVKTLAGGLILHLSQAYRAMAAAHQKIQAEDPTFPNLLGHGGILAPDPTPDGMGGAGKPGYGDGLDDVSGPEINAGMDGMAGAGSTDGGSGAFTDADLAGLADDQPAADPTAPPTRPTPDYGDVGDEDEQPPTPGGMNPDDDEDEDNPMSARRKGYEVREDRITLVREKGLPIAFERARRLLDAHEQALRREFQGSDLNVLRFAADNLEVMDPKQQAQFKAWCREKAMKGLARSAALPPMDSPEYLKAVEREVARLLAAKS